MHSAWDLASHAIYPEAVSLTIWICVFSKVFDCSIITLAINYFKMFKTQNIGLLNHNEWNTATIKSDGEKSLQIRIVSPPPPPFFYLTFFLESVLFSSSTVPSRLLRDRLHRMSCPEGDQPPGTNWPQAGWFTLASTNRGFETCWTHDTPCYCPFHQRPADLLCHVLLLAGRRTLRELSNGTLAVFLLASLSKTPQSFLEDIELEYYQSLLVGICYHQGLQSSYFPTQMTSTYKVEKWICSQFATKLLAYLKVI